MAIELVTGWTEELLYTLKNNGVAVSLSGATVVLVARDSADNLLTLSGTVSVPGESTGQVQFAPAPSDITSANSPYRVRFKVTAADGRISYFPNKEPERWIVKL